MEIRNFTFGSIEIDGLPYDHDVVLDHGRIRARKKKPSKRFRNAYGHTPLSPREEIPWNCRRLLVGTGAHGALPVTPELEEEARARKVELVVLPTAQAIELLMTGSKDTNAILHVTC